MIILGIDPGAKGALALYDTKTRCPIAAWPMPSYQEQKKIGGGRRVKGARNTAVTRELKYSNKTKIDIARLCDLFNTIRLFGVNHAVIENVQGRGNQIGSSAFGFSIGLVHFGCVMIGAQPQKINVAEWRNEVGLRDGEGKDASLRVAGQLFPSSGMHWNIVSRTGRAKPNADMAEAVLMAHAFAEKLRREK